MADPNAPVVLTSALITLYTNNNQYKEVASVSFSVDYGEYEIYQIDSPYPAEIAGGPIRVSGSVNGFRIKNSGGLEGKGLRPLFNEVSAAPYVSIRISDRSTQEDIIFIPQAKITVEGHDIPNKGIYRLNFQFKGIIPYFALDRS